MQPITLIHPFQVEKDQEQVFLSAWKNVDQYMKTQQGFIETKLHQLIEATGPSQLTFINISLWTSVADFQLAIKNELFWQLAKHVLVYSKGAGLYEVIHN